MAELKWRSFVRTANSPIVDYAECLIAQRLHATLASTLTADYDAMEPDGTRYQINLVDDLRGTQLQ